MVRTLRRRSLRGCRSKEEIRVFGRLGEIIHDKYIVCTDVVKLLFDSAFEITERRKIATTLPMLPDGDIWLQGSCRLAAPCWCKTLSLRSLVFNKAHIIDMIIS